MVLKVAAPGVPDFYQGTERWDFSMVDPDNRRPVDYGACSSALATLENPDWVDLPRHWPDGRVKLAWTRELLRIRSQLPELFARGDYVPLEVDGRDRDHVIAFARRAGKQVVVVAVARWFAPLTDGGRSWPDMKALQGDVDLAELPSGPRKVRLSDLFGTLPVAVTVL